MSPEEKQQIYEDTERIMRVTRTLYRPSSKSREHILACLNDRIIEIKEGRWDND